MKKAAYLFLLIIFTGCAAVSKPSKSVSNDAALQDCYNLPKPNYFSDLKLKPEGVYLAKWDFDGREEVFRVEKYNFQCEGNVHYTTENYIRQDNSLWLVWHTTFDYFGYLNNKHYYLSSLSYVYEVQKNSYKLIGTFNATSGFFELMKDKYNAERVSVDKLE